MLPTPLESFVHGVAIPLPEVLEKNTDSVWALWSESVSAEEPNLFINTVKLQT